MTVNWAGVAVGVLALAIILAWDLVCYAWVAERVRLLDERVTALEPIDDSPGHEADLYDEPATDEFPAVDATVPDLIPLAVQSALLRPSPVPRGKSAEWVEDAIVAMRVRNAERMARAITEEAS